MQHRDSAHPRCSERNAVETCMPWQGKVWGANALAYMHAAARGLLQLSRDRACLAHGHISQQQITHRSIFSRGTRLVVRMHEGSQEGQHDAARDLRLR